MERKKRRREDLARRRQAMRTVRQYMKGESASLSLASRRQAMRTSLMQHMWPDGATVSGSLKPPPLLSGSDYGPRTDFFYGLKKKGIPHFSGFKIY